MRSTGMKNCDIYEEDYVYLLSIRKRDNNKSIADVLHKVIEHRDVMMKVLLDMEEI